MEKQKLEEALQNKKTYTEIAKEFNVSYATVKRWVKKYKLPYLSRKIKYTKEVLEENAKKSISYADLMRRVTGRCGGSTFDHVKNKIKDYGIDVSHFLGRAAHAGYLHTGIKKKLKPDEVFSKKNIQRRLNSKLLKRVLLESGVPYKCECCGIGPEWNGKELVLQVDHKNGNWRDCRKENLRFVCPNCHTQQETSYNRRISNKCDNCHKKISSKAKWCKKCSDKLRRTTRKVKHRPSLEILLNEIKDFGYAATGRKYGVADNTIRKWVKKT